MDVVVAGLSHKSSLSNGEKLVTTRSVGSPTILLLRGLVLGSDSLLYVSSWSSSSCRFSIDSGFLAS